MTRGAPGPALPGLVACVVLVRAATWLLAGERYGFMSDELYFLDAARHPAAGYVDFPPMVAWWAAALTALGWDTVAGLRGVATALGIAVTLLGVDLTRRLGGGRLACWITALVLLFAPGFASVQSVFTMNVIEQFWWLAAFWLVVRDRAGDAPWALPLTGVVLGLGVLTKLSVGALALALLLAALLVDRALFRRRETWIGVGFAVLVASPFLLWQVAEGWPFVEFVGAYNSTPPRAMVLQRPLLGLLLTMNPAFFIVWFPGAIAALVSRDPGLRLIGTTAWLCLALFVAAGVKFYFAVPVFAVFGVAGALAWERWLRMPGRVGLRTALLVLLASGALALPTAAPLLPAPALQRLADFLQRQESGGVPDGAVDIERYFPHFAEMHGWPELVALTAEAWRALPVQRRAGAVIYASHYGQAGALNRLDAADALPEAHGRHMSYHLWSRGIALERGLFVGFEAAELEALFGTVEPVARLDCRRCMAREQGLSVFYVEAPRLPPAQLHARLRRYDFF